MRPPCHPRDTTPAQPASAPPPLALPTRVVVGIDVSKDRLDGAVLSAAASCEPGRPTAMATMTTATTVAGLGQLITHLDAVSATLVVLEASGGFEQPVVQALWAAKVPVAVVNPARVRQFARSAGYGAKTDRVDATVLAHFGLVMRPIPQTPPPPALAQLRRLIRRREQLVDVLAHERQRVRQWRREDAAIATRCQALITVLLAEVAAMAATIMTLRANNPQLDGLVQQVESVPGIGPIVATTLIAELPELGVASSKEIAALAGLAPYARESGQWRGTRHIRGGRTAVRRMLYLAAVNARRCHPEIRGFYERLRASGKPVKVALVACARKLLVIVNALVRDGSTWVDRPMIT